MRPERLAALAERLRPIVEPFAAPGPGISIAIEDADGRQIAGPPAGALPASDLVIRHGIITEDGIVGHVVGRGGHDVALLEAVAGAVAAATAALLQSAAGASVEAAATAARIDAELELGRRIQRSFIPLVPPSIEGYELANHYEAARQVGGDFFDAFRVRGPSGRLALCIADVTGKGIAAALLMAFARPLLHAAIDQIRTPAAALERTNQILVEERRSALYITALCATIDLRRGQLLLANAGHEPPLLVPADGSPVTWLGATGPLLGAFARLDLDEHAVQLAPGDLVLLYTDGVTDAQSRSGERFGDERLLEAVTAARGGTANEVVQAVCDSYHRFQADQPNADDVAILAIRRTPRPTRPARRPATG